MCLSTFIINKQTKNSKMKAEHARAHSQTTDMKLVQLLTSNWAYNSTELCLQLA